MLRWAAVPLGLKPLKWYLITLGKDGKVRIVLLGSDEKGNCSLNAGFDISVWFNPLTWGYKSVFPTVQGPDRARRTDCQEPGTGRDGRKYAVLVRKI